MTISKFTVSAALLLCSSLPMAAQFSNSGTSKPVSSIDIPASYSMLSVGYDYNMISADGVEDINTNGIAVQYTSGMSILSTHPLYFEWNVRAALGFWSDSESNSSVEAKLTTLNLSVPVNLAYRLPIGEAAAITPYTGLHLKGNILASYKLTNDESSKTYNMFDKDDVGKDGQWKRFQFGWQIGTRVNFSKFNVGFEYGIDFNDIWKKAKTSEFLLSVGIDI